jgi:DNA topoisomerase IA
MGTKKKVNDINEKKKTLSKQMPCVTTQFQQENVRHFQLDSTSLSIQEVQG